MLHSGQLLQSVTQPCHVEVEWSTEVLLLPAVWKPFYLEGWRLTELRPASQLLGQIISVQHHVVCMIVLEAEGKLLAIYPPKLQLSLYKCSMRDVLIQGWKGIANLKFLYRNVFSTNNDTSLIWFQPPVSVYI